MILRASLLALALSVSAPAVAQSDSDRAAAGALITRFDTATRQGDVPGILSVMPPRVLALMSATFSVEIADLRETMAAQTEQMLAMVEIDDFGMDLAAAQGGVTETGRSYFIVSTQTTMTVTNAGQVGRVRATSDTLAFEDDGEWWLMRVESPYHEQVLAQTYPDLAGLTFAPGTMEELP